MPWYAVVNRVKSGIKEKYVFADSEEAARQGNKNGHVHLASARLGLQYKDLSLRIVSRQLKPYQIENLHVQLDLLEEAYIELYSDAAAVNRLRALLNKKAGLNVIVPPQERHLLEIS